VLVGRSYLELERLTGQAPDAVKLPLVLEIGVVEEAAAKLVVSINLELERVRFGEVE